MKNLNPEHFPELYPEVLQRLAGEWVEKYPSIQKITLFKYSLRDRSSTSEYAISATYDPEHPEAEDYLTWTFGNESCGHVIAQLADAYNGNPPSNYEDNWIWFDDKPGEEDLNPFIVPEKKYVLYPPPITPISSEGGKQQKKIFPCEPGTEWKDIHITLISDDTVEIKTPEITTPSGKKRFGYSDLGLKDERNDKPKKLWTYIVIICKTNGFVSAENFRDLDRINAAGQLVTYASKLNKHLQELFGIKESIYTSHYKKKKPLPGERARLLNGHLEKKIKRTKGYKTKIKFSDATLVAPATKKTATEEVEEIFQERQGEYQS